MLLKRIACLVLVLSTFVAVTSTAAGPAAPLVVPPSANVTDADIELGGSRLSTNAPDARLAAGATLEVSQPVQITSDSHYERGQSIVYDGSNYWLFYGRSASATGNYGNSDPDTHDYQVYYKKAGSVAGLVSAAPTLVSGVASNANSYLGETGAAYFGSDVWAFATIDVGATADLYGWWTGDGGTTWNEVGPLASLSDGQGHHDEVAFGGELWVVEGSGNFTTMHTATPKTGGWSTPLAVGSLTGGTAHFFVDGADLYLALTCSSTNYIFKYNSGIVAWDLVDSIAAPNKYDPTLFKAGSEYVYAQAPWDSVAGRQYIIAWAGDSVIDSFFDVSYTNVTEGRYGSNSWVDMWPIGFTDAGGTSYLFYTSERDQPSAEGTGNIWYLKWDWPTDRNHHTYVQEAIDAAASGDVVEVAAGTYVENIWVNKSLELAGAGASSVTVYPAVSLPNPCSGSSLCGSRTGASNIILTEASDITIHGFTLDGDNPALTSGIARGGADLDARNGIIEYGPAGVFDNLAVYETTVKNIYLRGIYANSYGSGFNIHDNIVTNVQGEANSIAIFNFGGSGTVEANEVSYANDAIAANHSKGTQFLDNIVTHSGSGVHTDNNGSMGGVADVLRGNSVSACTTSGYGVWVFAPYLAVSVEQNTVTGCYIGLCAAGQFAAVTPAFARNTVDGQSSALLGVYVTTNLFGWGSADVLASFSNNFVHNNSYGVYVESEATFDLGVVLGGNSIVGNTYATAYDDSGTISADASANWWGSADPATVATTVSGGSVIDYTPWLASGTDTDLVTVGFQGDFSTLWVDDDSPQTGTTGRIAEAIDLVSGSTVNLAAGEYVEQVLINEDLDLIGAGEASTTIRAPATRTGSVTQGSYVHDYLLAAYATSGAIDVRVEGVTLDLDGRNKTAGTDRLDGVFFRDVKDAGGSTAGLFASTIHNFAATPDYESWGVAVFGDSALTVNDCDISEYTRDGIAVYGNGTTGPAVVISNNKVTGSATGLNGIGVMDGATGSITGNAVSGNTRSSPWAGVGIGVWSDGLQVTGNQVDGNKYGIDIGADGTLVSGNTLTDNVSRGISLDSANNNTVSDNTITGPVAGTDDVAIGLANNCTGNIIGGPLAADGNTIVMATSGSWTAPPLLYAIHVAGSVGAGNNTIQFNSITGGKRGIQVDGGNTGTTTIANNTLNNAPALPDNPIFGIGINGGSAIIRANTLNNTVRPIEVWGATNLTIEDNIVDGSTFAAINLGGFSGTATVEGNTIHGLADASGIWAQTSGVGLTIADNIIYDISGTGAPGYAGRGIQIDGGADGADIDGNEVYNITGFAGIVIDTGATGVKLNDNYVHDSVQGMAVNDLTAEFTGNRVLDNRWGIDLYAPTAVTWVLRSNQIAGNTTHSDSYGLTAWAGSADAILNWWGNASGPYHPVTNPGGGGDAVSDNVDYCPWWTTAGGPASAGLVTNLNTGEGFCSIQAAIGDADTANGHTISVAAGTYDEDVNVNKSLTVLGAGAGSTNVRGVIGGDSATFRVAASNVTIAGFTITRLGNNVTDWNNPGLNLIGVAIQGASNTSALLRDNIITGNRTGIDINYSSGHTIRNNAITFNRTGMIMRNPTDNLTVVENDITDNWTVGVLFLDASSGSNVPVQTALNCSFFNNDLSGNWYGQIVDRQTGGSLPAPGTTNLKDFSGNWLGTTAPVVSTVNSSEPGYSAQIPVAYGGTAVPPGGQPDILGPASANIDLTPFLGSGTDTDVETTSGRGTNGFQGDFSALWVTVAGAQTGTTGRIQEGINLVSGSTLYIANGLYKESNLLIDEAMTIEGESRGGVVIVPAAEDANVDSAFGSSAQNGFVIKAHDVKITKLTLDGRGNTDLTPGKNNYRAGIVSADASYPGGGGGAWNNLHVDQVTIKYPYRRGISVFPKTVSGIQIENSRVEHVHYNHGIYVAGQSEVVGNEVDDAFQGIVLDLDATTPAGLCKVNGNTLTYIGIHTGCWGYPNGQPRGIQFNNADSAGRPVEIKNNTISDNGLEEHGGAVGIYTRLANASSVVEGNDISLSSGVSWADPGSQAVGMLLGWSYDNGFLAKDNVVHSTKYGIGVMIFGNGTATHPLVLEGNTLTSSCSAAKDTGDGTGIYIANQYLFAGDKNPSYVILQNGNSINGYVVGIAVEKIPGATDTLTLIAHSNSIAGNRDYGLNNTTGTLVDATNNWWGDDTGPLDVLGVDECATGSDCSADATLDWNVDGLGNKVSDDVDYCPWLADPPPELGTQLYLDPSMAAIANDHIATKTYTVRLANADDLYGYQFVITFDPANLECTAAAFDGSFFPLDPKSLAPGPGNHVIDNVNGKVYFARTLINPEPAISGSGPLATLTLRGKSGATAAAYQLGFDQVKLTDIDANVLPCVAQSGWLTLYDTGSLSGSVDLQGRGNESGGVVTIIWDSGYSDFKTITAADGSWSFTGIPVGSYQVIIEMARYLDAYQSGVTVTAGGTALTKVKLLGGDATDNDEVLIEDASIIGGDFGRSGGAIVDIRADINNDLTVDILDLVLMGGNYAKISPVPW